MTVYEERQAQKARWEKYRKAAVRLYPDARVKPAVALQEDAERTGAFIEISVWIPSSEIVDSE